MKEKKNYIIISTLLIVLSVCGMIATLVLNHVNGGLHIISYILMFISSLVFIASILTLLITRGGHKDFGQAFKGKEKKCLAGALTIMTAIVLSNGLMSVTRFQHHDMNGFETQEFGRGFKNKGGFQQMPGQLPNQSDQNQIPDTNNQTQQVPDQNQTPDTNNQTQQAPNQTQDNSTQTQPSTDNSKTN